jgi:hypothetical protein
MSDSNQKTVSWLSHHWVQITAILVGGIILLGIIKVIYQLFNGTGPVSQGVAQILGTFANVADGLTNGCSIQPDCSTVTNTDSCNTTTNCKWSPSPTSGGTGDCLGTSGNPPGTGGPTTLKCGLFVGWIAYIAGTLVLLILGGFIKSAFTKENPNSDIISKLEGKSTFETFKDLFTKAKDISDKAATDPKIKDNDKLIEAVSSEITIKIIDNNVTISIKGQSGMSPEQIADLTSQVMQNTQKALEEQKDKNEKKDLDPNEVEDVANEALENEGIKPSENIKYQFDMISKYDKPINHSTFKYLTENIKKHNIPLKDYHINYLNKYK